MKRRNPRYGCPRIAQQINLAFGLELDKDVVRRILATHYQADPSNNGPSWLITIGHAEDSLWSVDLFRCESILLKSHWVMVVMDQYTRRIIGFGVHAGNVDGPVLCRMFNDATSGQGWPKYLSSDNGLPPESRDFSQMSPSNVTVTSDLDGNNNRCNQLFQ